jgi:hypothetical protein
MLKLSIQCTTFESNYTSCTGKSSENICSSSSAGKKERGDETQFTTKLFRFVKVHSQLSIWCPIMRKLAVLAPNRLTLRITLLDKENNIIIIYVKEKSGLKTQLSFWNKRPNRVDNFKGIFKCSYGNVFAWSPFIFFPPIWLLLSLISSKTFFHGWKKFLLGVLF